MRRTLDAAVENSLYIPGDTLLHRVDPRLKACACLLLVALAFSSAGWLQFLLPLLSVGVAVWIVSPLPSAVWRACWMLRWLLIFTLTSYMLFSQGRTLLGVSWLSYDGLVMGSMVCAQLLLAVVTATLLSITTPVADLARAFGWFVKPLHWLGCRTDEWQKILLLTINFLPAVHEEISRSKSPAATPDESVAGADVSRWGGMPKSVIAFVQRLLDRGDKVACRLASGDDLLPSELPALLPLTLQDKLFALCLTLITFTAWLAG